MSASPDTTAWLRGLADTAGSSDPTSADSVDASVEAIVAGVARRRRTRRIQLAGGLAIAAGLAALVLSGDYGVGRATSSDEVHYQAPAWEQGGALPQRTEQPRPERPEPRAAVPPVDEEPEVLDVVEEPVAEPAQKNRKPAPLPTADELLAQANAARAEKDAGRARAKLLELRRRFPGTKFSEHATFLLGRVELELASDPASAHTWFVQYLEEYPEGRFAAQARGRVLRYLSRHASTAEAAVAARDYLSHHENGPYADFARSQLGALPD